MSQLYSDREVRGVGPRDAKIIFLGEAPGGDEDRYLEPFCGKIGWLFSELLATVGINRDDVYIDNVFPYRPRANKIEIVPRETLEHHFKWLHRKIVEFPNVKVIVPMGNYALFALTGEGIVKWSKRTKGDKKPGITSLRGTVFPYTALDGRHIKIIPTLHPQQVARDKHATGAVIYDLRRVLRNLEFDDLRIPQRELIISPSFTDVEELAHRFSTHTDPIGYDIENPAPKSAKKKPIMCISFTDDDSWAMSVPTTKAYWGAEALKKVIAILCEIIRMPNPKITQNGIYDHYCLAWEWGVFPTNWHYDTMAMSHCSHPAEWSHALDFMASVWTDEPYWKDEAKASDEANQWAGRVERYWEYNCKDSAVMYEIYRRLSTRLIEQGRMEFYWRHYASLFEILLEMSLHGIAVNDELRRQRLADCTATCIELQDEVSELAGMRLYATKSLSRERIKQYLYDQLRLPQRKKKDKQTGDMKVTADEVTIRKLMLKFPNHLSQTGKLILEHTRIDTLSRFYQAKRLDDDQRMRCQYWMTTEEGRLKSKANPMGTGSNLQNQDRECRDMFEADPGCVMVSIDYSQIEARILDLIIHWLTGNTFYLERALSKPWERDTHRETAMRVFPDIDLDALDEKAYKKHRYLGKKTRHALPRGLGPDTLQEELLKDGYVHDVTETKQFITNLLKAEPEHTTFFRYIENEICERRVLVNSWGRCLDFPWDRTTGRGCDETFRRGYSFHMQSDARDLLSQHGLIPFYHWRKANPNRAWVNVDCHDEIAFSARPATAYATTQWLVSEMERPHTLYGVEFSCPTSVTVGRTWEGAREFKQFPTREEFDDILASLV